MIPADAERGAGHPPSASGTRRVLVTGGTRGIGEAIVRALAARGCAVGVGFARSRSRAEELALELDTKGCPVCYRLDQAATSRSAVQTMASRFGGIDGLVLNAGVWDGGRLSELSATRWEAVVTANLFGAEELCRAALPWLAQSATASVTVVSSVMGIVGGPGDTAYATAKSGLIGFARSLAKEWAGLGVRVNVLAPGFVETDMTRDVPATSRANIARRILLRRPGRVEEIATSAVFLSEDATYCTGTVLTADGGWSL